MIGKDQYHLLFNNMFISSGRGHVTFLRKSCSCYEYAMPIGRYINISDRDTPTLPVSPAG